MAGREKITDKINPRVGIILHKKVNDFVNANDSIATIYSDKAIVDEEYKMILDAYKLSDKLAYSKLILDIVK